jgi:hypothetical protein
MFILNTHVLWRRYCTAAYASFQRILQEFVNGKFKENIITEVVISKKCFIAKSVLGISFVSFYLGHGIISTFHFL